MKEGLQYFQQALDEDPTYAPAYAGVADAYLQLGGFVRGLPPQETLPRARAAALKALELDKNSREALASLALWYEREGDWAAAEKQFKRALEMGSNYVPTHHWYASFCSHQGRHEEALAHVKRAQDLDPLFAVLRAAEALLLYDARKYDEVISQSERALELDANASGWIAPASFLYVWRGLAYLEKGMGERGIADLERAAILSHGNPFIQGALGFAYGRSGRKREALNLAQKLKEESKRRYVAALDIALIYIGLEDKQQALAWLEKAYEARDVPITSLRVSPLFDSLRDDPRFQALLQRMNFPE